MQAKIGIVGGSGLYELEAMENVREVEIDTPFGPTSDKLIWALSRDRCCICTSSWSRPPSPSQRSPIPREYLRTEETRRRICCIGFRGWLTSRRIRAWSFCPSRSIR